MSTTILTLANGKGIDLLNPKPSDYSDWDWVAEHLAKDNRFSGATPGVTYSVAEHQCRGVDAILSTTGDRQLAAYFSLHDDHEAPLGDDTTPKKCAIAQLIETRCGILAPKILQCFGELTDNHDKAVHEAAGLPWPMTGAMRALVKHWDLVMFVTEWRDLMRGIEHPNWDSYRNIAPLPDTIRPWDWQTAKWALLRRWDDLLPVMNRAAA